MNPKRVQVKIDGLNFYVVGHDDPDYIRTLAEELNSQIKETYARNYRLSQLDGLILTALNLLDERHKTEEKIQNISTYSQDQEKAKETLDQLEGLETSNKELKDRLQRYEKRGKDLSEERDRLARDLEKARTEAQELRAQCSQLAQEKEDLLKGKEALEEKNYQDQLQLTDLQKEISLLRGED
ncbi:MAG: cell division protein ZapA [Tissierellia bacterium]|nr:cell division protein ZapA [Tissierellia bacterium]